MSRIRQREIHARRTRKAKLRKLRERYRAAGGAEKTKILEKLAKVSPSMKAEDFTAIAKR